MPDRFPTTRWSIVLTAGARTEPGSEAALEELCRSYWQPLYAFVRRTGRDPETAQDLTQAFFMTVLEKDRLKAFEPERGRFRTFLLAALKHFLADEYDRETALKRGGGLKRVEFDPETEEALGVYRDERTPEHIFERRWAERVFDQALEQLKAKAVGPSAEAQFEALKPYLSAEEPKAPYREIAERLGSTEDAIKVAAHRLRRRFRAQVRSVVEDTVDDATQVDDEIRFLSETLRSPA